jgi:sortase A
LASDFTAEQTRLQPLLPDDPARHARIKEGHAVAILQIPIIGVNLIVGQGDAPSRLHSGLGHRPGTPLPGQVGNSLIFGHRHGWGGPLAKLKQLQPKNQIVVQTPGGSPVLYLVTSVRRTRESNIRSLAPSDDYRLTLVTGSGGLFSTDRLIVTAVSGDQGKLSPSDRRLRASTPGGSAIVNATTGMLLVLVVGAMYAGWVLGRRYRPVTVAVVVVPLSAAALLALSLNLDLLLPPLR